MGCGPSALEKELYEAEMKRADLLAQEDLRNMGYDDEDIFSDSDFSSSEDEEQPEEEEEVGERDGDIQLMQLFSLFTDVSKGKTDAEEEGTLRMSGRVMLMMLSERSMDAAMLHRFMCSMCCSAGAVSIPCFDDAAKISSEIGNEMKINAVSFCTWIHEGTMQPDHALTAWTSRSLAGARMVSFLRATQRALALLKANPNAKIEIIDRALNDEDEGIVSQVEEKLYTLFSKHISSSDDRLSSVQLMRLCHAIGADSFTKVQAEQVLKAYAKNKGLQFEEFSAWAVETLSQASESEIRARLMVHVQTESEIDESLVRRVQAIFEDRRGGEVQISDQVMSTWRRHREAELRLKKKQEKKKAQSKSKIARRIVSRELQASSTLRQIKCFSKVQDLSRVVGLMEMRDFRKNAIICKYGSEMSHLWVIMRGEAALLGLEDKVISRIGKLEIYGESALESNPAKKHSVTMRAMTKVRAMCLSRESWMARKQGSGKKKKMDEEKAEDAFEIEADAAHEEMQMAEDALHRRHSIMKEAMAARTANRLAARKKMQQTRTLSKIEHFQASPKEAIEELLKSMRFCTFPPGTTLCKIGDDADELHCIVSGTVEVFICDPAGKNFHINTLKVGDSFGDNALVGKNLKRTATCITVDATSTLALSRQEWKKIKKRAKPGWFPETVSVAKA